MSSEFLKAKIHKAIDNIDDDHLLEVVLTILNKNTRFNEIEFFEEEISLNAQRTNEFKSPGIKNAAISEVKKKILENLER